MNKIIENLNNAFIEINELIKFGNQINLGTLNSNLKNETGDFVKKLDILSHCLLYTSPSPRDGLLSRMPSSA